jgi:hypothetical protein
MVKSICKDPELAQLIAISAQFNPEVAKMSCDQIKNGLGELLVGDVVALNEAAKKKAIAEQNAAPLSSGSLLLLVGGAFLLSRGRN